MLFRGCSLWILQPPMSTGSKQLFCDAFIWISLENVREEFLEQTTRRKAFGAPPGGFPSLLLVFVSLRDHPVIRPSPLRKPPVNRVQSKELQVIKGSHCKKKTTNTGLSFLRCWGRYRGTCWSKRFGTNASRYDGLTHDSQKVSKAFLTTRIFTFNYKNLTLMEKLLTSIMINK